MLSFDVMLAANLVFLAVALVRLRGATFILIANICVMLRALSTIEEFGQPRTQGFLPPAVFDPSRLVTAGNIFAIVTVVAMVAVAIPSKPPNRTAPLELPPLPKWLVTVLALYFIALALSSKTILTGNYTDMSRGNFQVPQGGLLMGLQVLVVYEIYRRVHVGSLTAFKAFGVLLTFLIITDYSKGSTGGATGLLLMASFLLFGRRGSPTARAAKVGTVLSCAIIFTLFVRGVRSTLHSEGTGAVGAVSEQLASREERRTESAEGIESNANGAQYAAHVLECALLFDSGYSREWRSLYEPIVYTFQPSFLLDLMGWERTIEPAWELAKHFIHGGGIAIFGEMYWNGGYVCVAIVTPLVFLLAYLGDTLRNRSFEWLIFYCMYTSVLVYGVGYGLPYLFRGASNALLVIGIYKLFGKSKPTEMNQRELKSAVRASPLTS